MSIDTTKKPGQALWRELSLDVSTAVASSKSPESVKLGYDVTKKIRTRYWPKLKEVVASAKGLIATIPSISFSQKIMSYDEVQDYITLYAVKSIDEYKLLELAYIPYPVAEVPDLNRAWFCHSWLKSPSRWVFGKPLDKVLKSYVVFPQLVAAFPFKYDWIPATTHMTNYGAQVYPGRYMPIGYSRYRQLRGAKKTSAGIGLGFLEKAGSTEAEQYGSLMNYIRRHYSEISIIERNRELAWIAPGLKFDAITEHMIRAFIRVNILKVPENAAEQRTLSGVGEVIRRCEDSERGAAVPV